MSLQISLSCRLKTRTRSWCEWVFTSRKSVTSHVFWFGHFHELTRRKLRTSLTILGIMGGTMIFTVLGGMAEKLNLLMAGAVKHYSTRVIVQPRGSALGEVFGAPLSVNVVDVIKRVSKVDAAFPTVYIPYQEWNEEPPPLSLGVPLLVVGMTSEHVDYDERHYPVLLSAGRFFRAGEDNVAVVGFNFARTKKLDLGKNLTVHGRNLNVVGIMNQTLTAQDSIVYTPLQTAQELLAKSLPPPLNQTPYQLASQIEVYPTDLKLADGIAETINRQLEGIRALPPSRIEPQFRQSLRVFNAIAMGSAIIAVLVGGLSIFNIMMMSVSERRREIGVKKAVGATTSDIAKEFLLEALVIGLTGGALGVVTGASLVAMLNSPVLSRGIVIFAVTGRLILISVVSTAIISVASGLYPALRAACLKPVDALRGQ